MYIVLVHTFWELVLVTKQNILNVLYIKHVDFLLHIGLNLYMKVNVVIARSHERT